MPRGGEYMPDNRGLLCLHANAGITFNLELIRNTHPSVLRPARFRAFVGLANPQGLADVWVFVDGQLRFRRTGLRMADGPVRIDVELEANHRFLTLVSTDGDRSTNCDWVVFGDPVLLVALQQAETDERTSNHE